MVFEVFHFSYCYEHVMLYTQCSYIRLTENKTYYYYYYYYYVFAGVCLSTGGSLCPGGLCPRGLFPVGLCPGGLLTYGRYTSYWNAFLVLKSITSGYADTTFLATMTEGLHTPTDPIVFPIAVHNSGGHYNRTTGIYTAPIDGTYEFIIHILSSSDYNIGAYLMVDSTYVSLFVDEDIVCQRLKNNGVHIFTYCILFLIFQITYTWALGDSTQDERLLESVIVLSLTAGQQVWVVPSGISTMYGSYSSGMRSWFSGHLIHAL